MPGSWIILNSCLELRHHRCRLLDFPPAAKILPSLVMAKALYWNTVPLSGAGSWYLQVRVSLSHAKMELSLKQLRIVLLNGRKKDLLDPYGLADIQLSFSLEGVQVPELSGLAGCGDGIAA